MSRQKEIENQIMKLQVELQELNKSKLTGWEKVAPDARYYYVENRVNYSWEDDVYIDGERLQYLNYFSTEEKAREIYKEQLLYRKLKKFADENNEKFEMGYKIVKSNEKISYAMNELEKYSDFGQVYFSSEEIAQKAIETFRTELEEYFKINE